MQVKQLTAGPISNNIYILMAEDGSAAVIDPGFDAERVLQQAEKIGAKIQYVLLTHGHFDHTGCAGQIKAATGAEIALHEADCYMLEDPGLFARFFGTLAKDAQSASADIVLHDGDTLSFGELTVTVMHLPGHSPGSCFFIAGDSIFSGDILFKGCVGRTDLTGGDTEAMKHSLRRINKIEGDYKVYPGHDALTTLREEQRTNPYLLSYDYDIYD